MGEKGLGIYVLARTPLIVSRYDTDEENRPTVMNILNDRFNLNQKCTRAMVS